MDAMRSALLSTLAELADSKRFLLSLTSLLAASLVLVAGKLGWSWLDPDTSKLVAGVIVAKSTALVLAYTHHDTKAANAPGPAP